jgi:hypothetical protein
VRLEHAANDALYANSILHIQTTGLVLDPPSLDAVARAGAVGRTMRSRPLQSVGTSTPRRAGLRSAVLHAASGRRLPDAIWSTLPHRCRWRSRTA